MSRVQLRTDIDGPLFQCVTDGGEHIAKALSTATAWHAYEPQELAAAAGHVVQSVVTNLQEGVHWINYRTGVELLHLFDLREIVHAGGPLALWRQATLALALARELANLHDAELYQLVVHPGRLARSADRLVLLPTIAGVLPALPDAFENMSEGWLHYIAPEVLRTRSIDKRLLAAGDVYSLGRLIEVLCVTTPAHDTARDAFDLARRKVEQLDRAGFGELLPALAPLAELTGRMCAPLPGHRPEMPQVISALAEIVARNAPQRVFEEALARGDRSAARRCFDDLTDANGEKLFEVTGQALAIMKADLALAETPPNCNQAVLELERSEPSDRYDADIQLRLGRAYARWTQLPRHMDFSAKAYHRAAACSGWAHHVVDEWVGSLKQANDGELILLTTQQIPSDARPASVVALRARALLERAEPGEAWVEVSTGIANAGYDEELMQLAEEIARYLDPTDLVRWMHAQKEDPSMAGPIAVVWKANGNQDMYEQHLGLARARRN